MRRLLLLLVALAWFAACSGGRLTTDAAQSTINKWAANNGEVTVLGVHEIPSQNSAEAQLQFKNFKYKGGLNPFTANPNDLVWSGGGKAGFIHNNDGNWVLTDVVFTTPQDTYTYHPNIIVASESSTPNPEDDVKYHSSSDNGAYTNLVKFRGFLTGVGESAQPDGKNHIDLEFDNEIDHHNMRFTLSADDPARANYRRLSYVNGRRIHAIITLDLLQPAAPMSNYIAYPDCRLIDITLLQ